MADEIDVSRSLAELVGERPRLTSLFESLRLDYCCGGDRSLADACAERGLDADTVREMLVAFERTGTGSEAAADEPDWRQASFAELCDHITTDYHDELRRELPELAELFDTVVRVHGEERPTLAEARRAFLDLRAEIEPHIEEEETGLFPVLCELDRPSPPRIDPEWIAKHEAEHTEVGAGLERLRRAADDYDVGQALCSTHRLLLERLARFETEMHRHVHKENNILFRRARKLGATAATAG